MFDKFKDLNKLRKMQNALGEEVIEYEENGIKVILNGKMELIDIKLNPKYDIITQEKYLKKSFQGAMKQAQMQVAKKMMAEGF